MIRDEHIDAAVAQGILSQEQAARLRELAQEPATHDAAEEPPVNPDDEKFRLIGGFNDIFVTIGVLLLIGALVGLASTIGFRTGIAVLALVIAWVLSEIFSRRMRLALPSIVLALMFAGAAVIAAFRSFDILAEVIGLGREDNSTGLWIMAAGAGGLIAALAHERRFRVPIDGAIAATGLFVTLIGGLMLVAPDWTYANTDLLSGLFGLATFAVALRVDASDPNRVTRRSDVAFWLHLLAAPMIVHAVIPFLIGDVATLGTIEAVATLAIFAFLGLIAIVIDRRALIVSGLIYAGIAIGYLIMQRVESSLGLSLTLLALAGVVLGLSAGWRSLRRVLLPLIPLGTLRASVPPAANGTRS